MRATALWVFAAVAVGCQKDQPPEEATRDREVQVERQAEIPQAERLPLGEIASRPVQWSNRKVQGVAEVGQVVSDRGFWLVDRDSRVLAVVLDQPEERPVRIREGQLIRIREAIVRLPEELEQLRGDAPDSETRRLIREQGIFLLIEEEDIEVIERPGA